MEKEFFEFANKNYSKKEVKSFEKALEFSKEKFKGEKRIRGELSIEHNLRIGYFLVKSKIFPEVVVAGLLYGLNEKIVPSEINEKFGADISDLVFGKEQLKVIKDKNKCAGAEVMRKIMLTSLKDIRIIFVKLAAKLSNLSTIECLPLKKQKEIAKEVLEIYAPIGMRLGLEYIRRNLEDSALKIINPKKYNEIENYLKESRESRAKFILGIKEKVKNLLEDKIKVIKIKGREKHIYSIYKKLARVSLDEQKDHFAIRIIVKDVKDCYDAIGILHENFTPIEGTLKDYIASPKENGYSSIHTVIRTSEGKFVEIQIRTLEMDESSEEGVSAHWKYKGIKSDENFEKKLAWIRSVLELQNPCKDSELFNSIKKDILGDRIYCYTPLGKTIELPNGSVVVDFAYCVHQEIGDKCVGARVNGVFCSLSHKLNSGDVIEIITNKKQRPKRDWLKFAISSKAITKIRNGIKRYENIPAPKRNSFNQEKVEESESMVFNNEFLDSKYIFARCCCPLPKDELIGVVKNQKIILVHRKDCPNSGKEKIPVFWKKTFSKSLILKIEAVERSGILADTLNTISRESFVVLGAKVKIIGNKLAECKFTIVPRELENVVKLIERIKKVRGIKKIWFE